MQAVVTCLKGLVHNGLMGGIAFYHDNLFIPTTNAAGITGFVSALLSYNLFYRLGYCLHIKFIVLIVL
mgnify:CR=1 FL=1